MQAALQAGWPQASSPSSTFVGIGRAPVPVAVMASVVHRVDRSAFRRPREDGPRQRDSRAEHEHLLHGRSPFFALRSLGVGGRLCVCGLTCDEGSDDSADDSRAEFDPAVVVVVAVVALVAVVAVARRRRTYRLGVAHRVSGR